MPEETRTRFPIAGEHCVIPANLTLDGTTLNFSAALVGGIRPGMNIGGCSTSFMLIDDDGLLYLTQSGHCVYAEGSTGDRCTNTYEEIGSAHELEGYEEPAVLAWVTGRHMNEYGGTPQECDGWDIAILQVPESLRSITHPSIRHIGGPTGLADALAVNVGDKMVGYGNSDDRGFVVETVTGDDHGNAETWPVVNVFKGVFAGSSTSDLVDCQIGQDCEWERIPYFFTTRFRARYEVPKITGDSGSADLLADGSALGITSVGELDATTGSVPIYDTLLRIWRDTGVRYRLVTWPEWSPDTLET